MKNYGFNETQDWSNYFQIIFNNYTVDSILEFGLGVGTPYLYDNCNKLRSVELSLGDFNLEWYNKTRENMINRDQWDHLYLEVDESIKEANERAQKLRFPLDDTSYLKSLKGFFNKSLGNKSYDLIFVDAGIHLRGDLVNMSFGKAKIIAAHDTSRNTNHVLENIYGYNIVNVPSDYTEIHFEDTYMGTTVWIINSMCDLIDELKKYKSR